MKVGRDDEDRAQIRDLSQRLTSDLTALPGRGPGVCPRCSTWTPVGDLSGSAIDPVDAECTKTVDGSGSIGPHDLCENCVEVRDALDREPLALSVISLYRKPSVLRDVLTRYKGRDDEDDPADSRCVTVVRSMLGRYLLEHGDRLCELAEGVDGIVVVPSTRRPPPHPLEDVVDSLHLDLPRWSMLERGSGPLGFRQPNRDGYCVVMTREPSRLLLVDDVYTTGSRLNSAAAALSQYGHQTVAGLVLARRVNTAYAPEAAQLWATVTEEPFDWQASPRTVGA